MFFRKSPGIDAIGEEIVTKALERFGSNGLGRDDLALTLVVHPHIRPGSGESSGAMPIGYSYRGDVPFYPCSVIKMFYLAAMQAAFEAGRVRETAELERAMHDMIKWSSNTATNYIIDTLTGTTGDTEISSDEMKAWIAARNSINNYFQSLGIAEFSGINVSQKLMDDDRYGREKTFVQWGGNNHNRLTTDATASLLSRIMTGSMISPERSKVMAGYLHRSRDRAFIETPGAQVLGYLGEGMPAAARISSKAGWTGWTRDPLASYRRHDAIHVEPPTGPKFTLAVFTQGQQTSADFAMLPYIGRLASDLLPSVLRRGVSAPIGTELTPSRPIESKC